MFRLLFLLCLVAADEGAPKDSFKEDAIAPPPQWLVFLALVVVVFFIISVSVMVLCCCCAGSGAVFSLFFVIGLVMVAVFFIRFSGPFSTPNLPSQNSPSPQSTPAPQNDAPVNGDRTSDLKRVSATLGDWFTVLLGMVAAAFWVCIKDVVDEVRRQIISPFLRRCLQVVGINLTPNGAGPAPNVAAPIVAPP